MRTARWCSLALALVLTPALLSACGSGSPVGGARENAGTSSATSPDAAPSTQTSGEGGAETGATGGSGATGGTGSGDAVPPTLPVPSGAPRTPSDLMPTGVLVGTLAADSDGSCYTLRTDDNDVYALVGGDRRPLARGTVVRAKTTTGAPLAPAGCVGVPVAITSIEPV